MASDPRCPRCDGKVSARATWCMHCGADFEVPGDRGGHPVDRNAAAQSDVARFVTAFDRNDGTRQVLTILATGVALVPLVAVGVYRGGVGLALVGAVGLAIYFRLCGSARRIVVHGAYGTAALIACLHLAAADLDPASLPRALLDGPVLVIVALFVAAGWWTDQRVPNRH